MVTGDGYANSAAIAKALRMHSRHKQFHTSIDALVPGEAPTAAQQHRAARQLARKIIALYDNDVAAYVATRYPSQGSGLSALDNDSIAVDDSVSSDDNDDGGNEGREDAVAAVVAADDDVGASTGSDAASTATQESSGTPTSAASQASRRASLRKRLRRDSARNLLSPPPDKRAGFEKRVWQRDPMTRGALSNFEGATAGGLSRATASGSAQAEATEAHRHHHYTLFLNAAQQRLAANFRALLPPYLANAVGRVLAAADDTGQPYFHLVCYR